ncbi:MAG: holo-[acyl-carrier-protein] synthase [Phycisphaerae bacterium]|nr:holo-[acyl-carrier-protein] synthase [Phycisphaerae bacterium]
MEALAHGIDIVPIARIEQMLANHGDRFIERVFTAGERADAERVNRGRSERYAVRFAAKEAVLKALGTGLSGGITWQDVDVHRSGNGAPMLKMHGVAAEKADELGLQVWRLSMSHAGGMAMASVVAMGAASSDP